MHENPLSEVSYGTFNGRSGRFGHAPGQPLGGADQRVYPPSGLCGDAGGPDGDLQPAGAGHLSVYRFYPAGSVPVSIRAGPAGSDADRDLVLCGALPGQ